MNLIRRTLVVGTGPLLKKIYFPAYASVYGSVLATFYQSLIELGILGIALGIYRNVGWTWRAGTQSRFEPIRRGLRTGSKRLLAAKM